MVRILAVGLLRAAPRRVAQDVDGRRQHHRVARRQHLVADRLADVELQIVVERGATRHRHRERRRVVVFAVAVRVQVHAARSVAELKPLDAARGVVLLLEHVEVAGAGLGQPAHLLLLLLFAHAGGETLGGVADGRIGRVAGGVAQRIHGRASTRDLGGGAGAARAPGGIAARAPGGVATRARAADDRDFVAGAAEARADGDDAVVAAATARAAAARPALRRQAAAPGHAAGANHGVGETDSETGSQQQATGQLQNA